MRRNALGSNGAPAAPAAFDVCASAGASKKPSVKPAPAAAPSLRKVRRVTGATGTDGCMRNGFISRSLCRETLGRFLDRCANAHVRRAATDVARHRGVDVLIAWSAVLHEQCGCRHDLPGLAIAALRNVELLPRGLQR